MNMNVLLILLGAIASEVIGTTFLKLSEGFTRPLPNLLAVLGYGMSFYLMSLTLKQIPLGIAYAIWSGLGTVATVAVGVLVWKEHLDLARIIGIGMIIGGVLVLNFLSQTAAA